MFGLLSPDKTIETIGKGVDKVFFTDQEKAELRLKLLKAYEPFKKLQRLLALTVAVPTVLLYLIGGIFIVFGYYDHGEKIADYATDVMGYPFGAVVTLYLGGGLIEGAIGKFKNG